VVTPSESEELEAAATLATSARARAFAGWALATVILPAAGWVGAKLDTRVDVDRMDQRITALTAERAALRSELQALRDELLSTADEHPGRVVVLAREQRAAQAGIVRATATALAYETPARKRQKAEAADRVVGAYDHLVDVDHKVPSTAAELAIARIATP
jgi:hypothetical protein